MFKTIFALFIARNKEFYRDKGSMAWAVLFPVLAIIGCALAFSGESEKIFKVGTLNYQQENIKLLEEKFVDVIHYQDEAKAAQRISQHQLHLLIDPQQKKYWVNNNSSQGQVLEQIINTQQPTYQKVEAMGKTLRYVDWVLPGILGMNIMFGSLFGVSYVIVRYRKNGVLKRLQATPTRAFEFITAQVCSRLLIVFTANSAIFLGAIHLLGLTMQGSYLALGLISLIGTFCLISLGLLMASRTDSEELAGGLLNLAVWPMMFFSGVWFSLDKAPQWLQALTNLFPLTHLIHGCREIMLYGATLLDLKFELFMMLLMTAVFLGLGALLFRWNPE